MPAALLALLKIIRAAQIVGPDVVKLALEIVGWAREHGHALTDTDLAALRSYGAETAEQIDARINAAVARRHAPAKPPEPHQTFP